ncbi:MAG: hypothetical protein KGZ61_03715 [Sandarakinorhabdus sp.]|nr:hypothetical protein [Sandarakinorhabdus sp.]
MSIAELIRAMAAAGAPAEAIALAVEAVEQAVADGFCRSGGRRDDAMTGAVVRLQGGPDDVAPLQPLDEKAVAHG